MIIINQEIRVIFQKIRVIKQKFLEKFGLHEYYTRKSHKFIF